MFVYTMKGSWNKGDYFDGFVQERHNSSVLAIELRLSCTNPSILWNENLCMQYTFSQLWVISSKYILYSYACIL